MVSYLVLSAIVAAFIYAAFERFWARPHEGRFEPHAWVDLEEPEARGVLVRQPTTNPLRVAIAPVISPERSLGKYRGFVIYLANALGRGPVFLRRRSYAEVNDLVRLGACELAFVCTYSYVLGQRQFGMKLLVVPQIGGVTWYRSYIVVPRDSEARSLLDLEEKRFGSADIMSTSGWLYPMVWLHSRNRNPERFFSDHLLTGSHDRSVAAVAEGMVDGAAVDSLVYDQLMAEGSDIARRTKVIQQSPQFGTPPLVVPQDLDPALRTRLVDVLLTMHERDDGKEILTTLGIDRFVVPDANLYDSVRALAGSWESRR